MFDKLDTAEIEFGILLVIALARFIVYITKTKADDEYLAKAEKKWLKVLAIVFGLDLRQGRKKYTE